VRSFANRAGISPTALAQHKKGQSLPNLDSLLATAKTGNVNVLWLATGEGPMRPEEQTPTDHIQEKSADYVCDAQKGWIRKAVEAVEMMGEDAPADRKAIAVEKVFERLMQTDGSADIIEVMRVIREALEG